MLQVVDFSCLLQVAASLLTSLICSKSVKIRLFASSLWIRSQSSICSKPVDNLLAAGDLMTEACNIIGLMTEACNRLAANYAFLAVYSHTIIINVCECCVNYIKMLMQLTSITAITILTMFVYCIISDRTLVLRATNNVDACTQCAYLFFKIMQSGQK